MKKSLRCLCMVMTFVLFLTFALGCGSSDKESGGESAKDASVVSGGEEKKEAETVETNIEQQVIYDEKGIKVTALSLDYPSFGGPELKLLIESTSSKTITVQCRNLSVNGVMIDSVFSCEVAAGKKANDTLSFSSSDLKKANITTIKDIEFNLHFYDSDSIMDSYDSNTIKLTTNADASFVQTYDDSGTVAVDKNGIKIIVKKVENTGSFLGAEIYVYIENNSDKDVMIQTRDVSLNGFMVDPIFSSDICAGKKAYDTISFLDSALEDNGIEEITDLELYFHVCEADGWKNIFDSDVVNIKF